MELRVTPSFVDKYDSLSDDEVGELDDGLERLRHSHETVWARRNRVTGDGSGHWDSAWVIGMRAGGRDFHLYWQYYSDDEIVLIGLAEIEGLAK